MRRSGNAVSTDVKHPSWQVLLILLELLIADVLRSLKPSLSISMVESRTTRRTMSPRIGHSTISRFSVIWHHFSRAIRDYAVSVSTCHAFSLNEISQITRGTFKLKYICHQLATLQVEACILIDTSRLSFIASSSQDALQNI